MSGPGTVGRESCVKAAQSRVALEERAGCRAWPSGGFYIRFCSDLEPFTDFFFFVTFGISKVGLSSLLLINLIAAAIWGDLHCCVYCIDCWLESLVITEFIVILNLKNEFVWQGFAAESLECQPGWWEAAQPLTLLTWPSLEEKVCCKAKSLGETPGVTSDLWADGE